MSDRPPTSKALPHLPPSSPCALGSTHVDCRLIGAFGVSDCVTPTSETTWGELKQRFMSEP